MQSKALQKPATLRFRPILPPMTVQRSIPWKQQTSQFLMGFPAHSLPPPPQIQRDQPRSWMVLKRQLHPVVLPGPVVPRDRRDLVGQGARQVPGAPWPEKTETFPMLCRGKAWRRFAALPSSCACSRGWFHRPMPPVRSVLPENQRSRPHTGFLVSSPSPFSKNHPLRAPVQIALPWSCDHPDYALCWSGNGRFIPVLRSARSMAESRRSNTSQWRESWRNPSINTGSCA
jgi:hypothetical protein